MSIGKWFGYYIYLLHHISSENICLNYFLQLMSRSKFQMHNLVKYLNGLILWHLIISNLCINIIIKYLL